jgi:hypothetical protein
MLADTKLQCHGNHMDLTGSRYLLSSASAFAASDFILVSLPFMSFTRCYNMRVIRKLFVNDMVVHEVHTFDKPRLGSFLESSLAPSEIELELYVSNCLSYAEGESHDGKWMKSSLIR